MGPLVLKATDVAFSIIILNIINIAEPMPLKNEQRTSLAEWTNYNTFQPQGPGTYSFGYDVEDPKNDNIQFRDEERFANGTVRGSYGYLSPDGIVHIVHYTADKGGYRATFETYPRGQLKPVIDTDEVEEELDVSSALKAAVESKRVYKEQRVHEQHLRPIDKNTLQSVTNPTYISSKRSSNFYYKKSMHSKIQDVNGANTGYTDPYKFFVRKN